MKKYSFLFFLTMFIIGTDTFLVSPLLPTLTKLYRIDSSISGWMVSAYAIGYTIFALLSGPISDGRDKKKVMTYGLAAFAISTFLCGFATSFPFMLLFRLFAGISASFVTPQVWASIPIVVDKSHIVQVMGYGFIRFSNGWCPNWRLPCKFLLADSILYYRSSCPYITHFNPCLPAQT